MNLALVEFRAGKLDAAFETVERILDRGDAQADTWNLRAWIGFRLGKTNLAVESLHKAIELEPTRADHYLDLSTILANAGQKEAARKAVDAGLVKCEAKDRFYVQLGLLAKGERDLRRPSSGTGARSKRVRLTRPRPSVSATSCC